MTLNFEETTPGVHMAMWESPNSGNARTVVIIESLGQFTLYIDGDVAARDLDSFDAAVNRAQSTLTSGGSRRMVQMAGALVVFAAVGGAAFGLTHLLSGASGIATAVATESQSIVKDVTSNNTETQFTKFKPVQPRKKRVVVSSIKPTSTSASVPAANPVQPVTVETSIPAPTNQADAKIESTSEQVQAKANIEQPAQPSGPRIFSATRPVFSGAPEKQPVADNAPAPTTSKSNPVATVEAPKPAAPTAVAVETEPTSEVVSADQPNTPIEPEALPLPNRNPAPQLAALETETKNDSGAATVPAAAAPQVAQSPSQSATQATGQQQSADEAYQRLMERAAAKRRAKLEQRRRAIHANKYKNSYAKTKSYTKKKVTKKKIVKKKRVTKKARRTVRRKSRRVMRCMAGGCRWVARGGYYDRRFRGHY